MDVSPLFTTDFPHIFHRPPSAVPPGGRLRAAERLRQAAPGGLDGGGPCGAPQQGTEGRRWADFMGNFGWIKNSSQ